MRRMVYEYAQQLFRTGRFRELIESFQRTGERESDLRVRILVSHALALCGEVKSARALVSEIQHASTLIRSQREAILGIVSWRLGETESAWKHLNSALQAALESRDPERIAWASLQLLRVAIDARPIDALSTILPRARKAVTVAGIPSASAYLHVCVGTMEASRGHLDEAWRHCDI